MEVLISQCPTCCDSTDCIRTADSSCLTVERNTSLLKQLHCLAAKSCLTFSRSHELQPTRLLCPWDFPGKNTGVGSFKSGCDISGEVVMTKIQWVQCLIQGCDVMREVDVTS